MFTMSKLDGVEMTHNYHEKTVTGFGEEWSHFNQTALSSQERQEQFERYFKVFPWKLISKDSIGMDLGCGSGRWAQVMAPKVKALHCVDASQSALKVAERNLAGQSNCFFHHASVDAIPLPDGSLDFGYSLGVLHHIPDTLAGLRSCVKKLRPGAPFLVYLYYAFDNRPWWFFWVWKVSDIIRKGISRLPFPIRYFVTQIIAVLVYLPLATLASLAEKLGMKVDHFPLSSYRHNSFYTMRTDALDRFGTILEQRFTARQIKDMMQNAGLENIQFSDEAPYWCAVGTKKT